jgi:hypothetical protein
MLHSFGVLKYWTMAEALKSSNSGVVKHLASTSVLNITMSKENKQGLQTITLL